MTIYLHCSTLKPIEVLAVVPTYTCVKLKQNYLQAVVCKGVKWSNGFLYTKADNSTAILRIFFKDEREPIRAEL